MPLSDLQDLNNNLIRKTLNMSVFVAPMSADAVDEATLFTTVTGVLGTLPDDYLDLGYTTTAGAQFARAITESNVTSMQSLTPTRSDTTADTITLQVACQETKLATIGLATGAETSTITMGTNGTVRVDKPATPQTVHHRVFAIGEDVTDAGSIYMCRFLPKAKVTNYDAQNFAQGDDPVLWSVTFQGFVDDVLGTDHSWIFGGEGYLALKAAMGFS